MRLEVILFDQNSKLLCWTGFLSSTKYFSSKVKVSLYCSKETNVSVIRWQDCFFIVYKIVKMFLKEYIITTSVLQTCKKNLARLWSIELNQNHVYRSSKPHIDLNVSLLLCIIKLTGHYKNMSMYFIMKRCIFNEAKEKISRVQLIWIFNPMIYLIAQYFCCRQKE